MAINFSEDTYSMTQAVPFRGLRYSFYRNRMVRRRHQLPPVPLAFGILMMLPMIDMT